MGKRGRKPSGESAWDYRWLLEAANEYFGDLILGLEDKTRKQQYVQARYMAMAYMKSHTTAALKIIGTLFGGRDHSSVIHGLQQHAENMDLGRRLVMYAPYVTTYIQFEEYMDKKNPTIELPENITFSKESLQRNPLCMW